MRQVSRQTLKAQVCWTSLLNKFVRKRRRRKDKLNVYFSLRKIKFKSKLKNDDHYDENWRENRKQKPKIWSGKLFLLFSSLVLHWSVSFWLLVSKIVGNLTLALKVKKILNWTSKAKIETTRQEEEKEELRFALTLFSHLIFFIYFHLFLFYQQQHQQQKEPKIRS